MYLVMNVVHVKEERREAFERAFLERESHVHKAEGFAGFELLRRDQDGEYVVLSRWESKEGPPGPASCGRAPARRTSTPATASRRRRASRSSSAKARRCG